MTVVFAVFKYVERHLVRVFKAFWPGRPVNTGVSHSKYTVIPAEPAPAGRKPGAGIQRLSQTAAAIIFSRADAGGSPAATHFLCFAKESKQRKATRGSSPLRGSLRKALHGFPVQQARPMGRETPASPRNDRPLRNSGSWLHCAKDFVCARPQTVLAECPCRFCVTRRLSSGPGRDAGTENETGVVPAQAGIQFDLDPTWQT